MKKLIFLVLLLAFVLPATTKAQTCFFTCSSQGCYNPLSTRGQAAYFARPISQGYDVLVEQYWCDSYRGTPLYRFCYVYFCGTATGKMYTHKGKGKIIIFDLTSKEDARKIQASVSKDGIDKTAKKYHAIEIAEKDFESWQQAYLAAHADLKACAEGK